MNDHDIGRKPRKLLPKHHRLVIWLRTRSRHIQAAHMFYISYKLFVRDIAIGPTYTNDEKIICLMHMMWSIKCIKHIWRNHNQNNNKHVDIMTLIFLNVWQYTTVVWRYSTIMTTTMLDWFHVFYRWEISMSSLISVAFRWFIWHICIRTWCDRSNISELGPTVFLPTVQRR